MESATSNRSRLAELWDIRKQFVFYASYHNNPVNIAIHLVFIWVIYSTSVLFLQYTPALGPCPQVVKTLMPFMGNVAVNGASLLCLVYAASYIIMEPFAGGLALLGIAGVLVKSADLVAENAVFLGLPVWKVAVIAHLGAWIFQFIGHGVFEGRAPALLDSLVQSILTAPLFVVLEVLFFLGYRKEFYAAIMVEVNENIKAFNEQKKKKYGKKGK